MIAPSADGCNAGDRVNAKPAKPAKLLAWNDEVTRNPPSSRNATGQHKSFAGFAGFALSSRDRSVTVKAAGMTFERCVTRGRADQNIRV